MIFSTLAAVATAVCLASLLGPILGRLATQWFTGRGLSNLLVEMRGALLPFVLTTILSEVTSWPTWLSIGLVVGGLQGISVARWIARRRGEWSPSMLGSLALGRSRAALISARAQTRGAVVSTLSTTTVQVVLLEALMAALSLSSVESQDSLGASLQKGEASSVVLFVLIAAGCVMATEFLTAWLLQNRGNQDN